eukprot:16445612-Heterocapsa_arctica.AAC.1
MEVGTIAPVGTITPTGQRLERRLESRRLLRTLQLEAIRRPLQRGRWTDSSSRHGPIKQEMISRVPRYRRQAIVSSDRWQQTNGILSST